MRSTFSSFKFRAYLYKQRKVAFYNNEKQGKNCRELRFFSQPKNNLLLQQKNSSRSKEKSSLTVWPLFFMASLCYKPDEEKIEDENKAIIISHLKEIFYLLREENFNEIILPLIEAASYNPKITDVIKLIENGKLPEASVLFEDLLINDLDAKHIFLTMKGIILLSTSSYKEAEEYFSQALSVCKDDVIREQIYFYINALGSDSFLYKKIKAEFKHSNNKSSLLRNDSGVSVFSIILGIRKILGCEDYPKDNTNKKPILVADDKNRVIVRVWLPNNNSFFGSLYSVGHASLQAETDYISYWPGNKLCTYIEDILRMRRLPDVRIVLYGIKVEIIKKHIDDLKKSGMNWSVWGSSIFQGSKEKNCVGLTHFLLKQSGLDDSTPLYTKDILNKLLSATGKIFAFAGKFLAKILAIQLYIMAYSSIMRRDLNQYEINQLIDDALSEKISDREERQQISNEISDLFLVFLTLNRRFLVHTTSDMAILARYLQEKEREKHFIIQVDNRHLSSNNQPTSNSQMSHRR